MRDAISRLFNEAFSDFELSRVEMLTMSNTLLFVDDHPIYRDGLSFALSQRMPDLHVLTASNGAEAIDLTLHAEVDLVLSDYRLPDEDGISVLRRISTVDPSVALGLLCADLTPSLARRASAIGAIACLSKEHDVDALATILQRLFQGNPVFDVDIEGFDTRPLTEHRIRIIRFAARGLSNKEIARELSITERTVKDHWTQIFEQLNVSRRIQAIRLLQDQGFDL